MAIAGAVAQPPAAVAQPAAPVAAALLSPEVDVSNFKSILNELVMKVAKRPLAGGDISYKSLMTMAGGVPLYQAVVRISALDNKEFEGQPQGLRKSAEQSAAQVALTHLASVHNLDPRASTSRSKGAKLPNYKGRLQELLVQARSLGPPGAACAPVDITYSTLVVHPDSGRLSAPQFCSKVQVTAMNNQVEFHGEVCKERKTAEQSAAHVALQHFLERDGLRADAQMQADATALQPTNAKSELNELVMKVLARPTTNQDVTYTFKELEGSLFQAFVTVPSLVAGREFEGQPHQQKKAAEQSAAAEALKHFHSLPKVPNPALGGVPPPPGCSLAPGVPVPNGQGETPLTAALLARRKPGAQAGRELTSIEAKSGNHKSSLNEFIMKIVGRPLTSGDIVYTVRSTRGQFQATAQIPIIDEMEFAAAPRPRKRDAEQCAAQIALLYYQAKFPAGIASSPPAGAVSADGASKAWASADVAGTSQTQNFKSALNELSMRTAGRPLMNGDVVYIVQAVGTGQFQATVKPVVIDNTLEFTGDACMRKKDAQQRAAAKALEYFSTNVPKTHTNPAPAPVKPLAKPGEDPRYTDRLGTPVTHPSSENMSQMLASAEAGNFKSALNELVMRSCGRPLTRQDISYLSRPCGNGHFVTSVKVIALDADREFAGEARLRKRDAEQLSAKAALLYFRSLAGGTPNPTAPPPMPGLVRPP